MALATQCPHCHTTFRVAHDQLKLRAGLVRCGSCKQIFNGIENLLRPDEMEQATFVPQASAATPASVAPAPEPAQVPDPEQTPAEPAEPPQPETETSEGAVAEAASEAVQAATTEGPVSEDPLQRMTLVDFTHPASNQVEDEGVAEAETALPPARENETDGLEKTIDDLQRRPWRSAEQEHEAHDSDELDQIEHSEYHEPSFVTQGRRRQRIDRMMRILLAVGLPLLLFTLSAQTIYIFRNQLAAWFPDTKPKLVAACRLLGCQVGLPAQIEAVSIESNDLQAASADQHTLSLSVLMSNRSATVQAWPSIELTLNDAEDKPIARRVFSPRDYLSAAQDINKGFTPKSEQPVKLFFELSQLKASGYRVYLFYP